MISISRKMVFAAFAVSISFGVLILLGRIAVRLFVKNGEITKTNVEAPPFGRGGNVQPAGGRSRL